MTIVLRLFLLPINRLLGANFISEAVAHLGPKVRQITQPRLKAGELAKPTPLRANGPTDFSKLPGFQPYRLRSLRSQPCRLG